MRTFHRYQTIYYSISNRCQVNQKPIEIPIDYLETNRNGLENADADGRLIIQNAANQTETQCRFDSWLNWVDSLALTSDPIQWKWCIEILRPIS